MEGVIIGLGIIIIILLFIIIKQSKKIKNKQNQWKNEYLSQKQKELGEQLKDVLNSLHNLEQQRNALIAEYNTKKEAYDTFIVQQQHTTELISNQQQQLRAAAEQSTKEFIAAQKAKVEHDIQISYISKQNEYEEEFSNTQTELMIEMQTEFNSYVKEYEEKLERLTAEVNDFQTRRDAINEQILRQRAIDEKQDFYRICITDNDLEDIDLILSLRQKLHKTSFLDKITYDTFVSKYVKEMAKRVLEGRNPTGIYKVTNIKTNEIYIGKSTTVADRWQNHAKGAFGVGEIGDSQFQRALKKYGLQNFTWELLEETTKDKLSERERYYITFYDTVHYGYNMKVG